MNDVNVPATPGEVRRGDRAPISLNAPSSALKPTSNPSKPETAHNSRNFVCDDGDLSPSLFQSGICNFSSNSKLLLPKICRKCDSGRGSAPDPLGSSRRSPDPLVGWGADTPPHTPPHSAPRSSCPLTPNPGDATGHHLFEVKLHQCCTRTRYGPRPHSIPRDPGKSAGFRLGGQCPLAA